MNRKGFPKALKHAAKKGLAMRGDSTTYQQGNLTISVWQDNQPVVTISNSSDPNTTTTVSERIMIVQPTAIRAHIALQSTFNSWVELIGMNNSEQLFRTDN